MIKAYNVEIPDNGRKGMFLGGERIDDVREFVKSGARTAEIEWDRTANKTPTSVQSCYVTAIRRCGYKDIVKVVSRGKRLFLVRKDVE